MPLPTRHQLLRHFTRFHDMYLSHRLSAEEDGLQVIQEAVKIRRQLAADHADAFNPDLALSLKQLYRRLATDRPAQISLCP